jgi:hypothetical protein
MIIDPKFPCRDQMIKDNFDPKFVITQPIIAKALIFAQSCYLTNQSKYARRGQSSPERVQTQIKMSKIAEEASWGKIVPYLPNLSKPDYIIYPAKQKNWKPDLIDDGTDSVITIGCKSQECEVGFHHGVSWIFEYRAGKNYDCDQEIFGKDAQRLGNFICCSSINFPKRLVELKAIVAVSTLHDKKLFGLPKVESLRDNKLAVYLDDLERIFPNG